MSINMDPEYFSEGPNGERDANALDRALDDFVRGRCRQVNRLEPELATTVDRMFALADVSGMPGAIHTRPSRRLLPWKAGIPMKQIVSVASTIAAVVILAIGINASVPGFRDQSAGLGTAVPTSDSIDRKEYLVEALNSDDCNIEARSREELQEILSIVPSDSDFPAVSESSTHADQATIDVLNQTLRTWQACARFSNSFAAMTFETSGFIRRQIYPDLYTVNPYSVATIDEILDGFLSTDMIYGERTPAPGEQANIWSVLVVDESRPITISEDRNVIELFVNMVSPNTTGPEDQLDGNSGDYGDGGYVRFDLEGGTWRISLTERDHLTGIRYPSERFLED